MSSLCRAARPNWWSGEEGDLKYLIIRADPESKIPLK
jgi:hypothetical protein